MQNFNIEQITLGIVSIVGLISFAERVISWIIKKFNYAHNKVNEVENLKETLKSNSDDIEFLKEQNRLIIEGIRNLLRDRLKADALKYITQKEIDLNDLEEYDITYKIYKQMGGNGIGTKYHDEVMELPVKKR